MRMIFLLHLQTTVQSQDKQSQPNFLKFPKASVIRCFIFMLGVTQHSLNTLLYDFLFRKKTFGIVFYKNYPETPHFMCTPCLSAGS